MRDSHPASKLTGREIPRLLSLTVGFHRTAGVSLVAVGRKLNGMCSTRDEEGLGLHQGQMA